MESKLLLERLGRITGIADDLPAADQISRRALLEDAQTLSHILSMGTDAELSVKTVVHFVRDRVEQLEGEARKAQEGTAKAGETEV